MRIIKPGTPQAPEPEPEPLTGTCVRCGCTVECSEAEAQLFDSGRLDHPRLTRGIISCPTSNCGQEIFLSRQGPVPGESIRGIPPQPDVKGGG